MKINIGIIGFGIVGAKTAELILKNNNLIRKRSGYNLNIKKIADLDITSKRDISVKIDKKILTKDYKEILNDKDIDIVVELIGGIHPAYEIIIEALKKGKKVVTANKALLAEKGFEIFTIANKYNSAIDFEASVGGSIPILRVIKESLQPNKLNILYGILNGTCNYILTKMTEEDKDFNEVLKDAQKKGFAESDPTLDINGADSAHKAAVLAMLAFGIKIDFKKVYFEGIENIDKNLINDVRKLGFIIKLLGIVKKIGSSIEIRVHPTLIPEESALAAVKNEYNAIFIESDPSSEAMLYGKGAGGGPTSSAVVADIISLINKPGFEKNIFYNYNFNKKINELKLKPMPEIKSSYFVRLIVSDKPGVLSKIGEVLGKENISIAACIQMENHSDIPQGKAPIALMTHITKEKSINKAIKRFKKLKIVDDKISILRVEKI